MRDHRWRPPRHERRRKLRLSAILAGAGGYLLLYSRANPDDGAVVAERTQALRSRRAKPPTSRAPVVLWPWLSLISCHTGRHAAEVPTSGDS